MQLGNKAMILEPRRLIKVSSPCSLHPGNCDTDRIENPF